MGFYRAPNKRLIARGGGGRFRTMTLADVGMACCEECGVVFAPDLSKLQADGFIDPRDVREAQRVCPDCKADKALSVCILCKCDLSGVPFDQRLILKSGTHTGAVCDPCWEQFQKDHPGSFKPEGSR